MTSLTMSKKNRDIITVVMIALLGFIAFSAGFLTNELIKGRSAFGSSTDLSEGFSVFWEAWDKVEKNYIGTLPSSNQRTYGAVRGSFDLLNDPYTIFVEPVARDQERESLRGNFGGVGALLEKDENGDIVLTPIENNPAAEAGIIKGDILLAVDDHNITSDMTIEEVAEFIRGEEGSRVTLTVLHPDMTEPVEVTIIRDIILLPSVNYEILEQQPSVGYIRLNRFSGESSGEIEEALTFLLDQGIQSLVLDVRQNGGGLLDAAIDVSDHFLDRGPVVYQIGKDQEEMVFESSSPSIAAEIPMVVLVDGGTASAAEIVAGALQDRDRAILIGSTTFGKGSVQVVYDLSDGSSVHVTSARWLTPDRNQIDQHGLTPDIAVEVTEESITNGQDIVLEEAIAFLSNLDTTE